MKKKLITERNFKKISEFIETLFQVFMGLAFNLFAFFAIFLEFINFNKDTFGLTNYGFAIMLGLSSVCFSWARNIPNEQAGKAKRINENAIEALYGGIIFLMGSAFKYVAFAKGNNFIKIIIEDSNFIIYIPKFFAFICFLLAIIKFKNVATEILKIVYLTHQEDWEEQLIKKESSISIKRLDNTDVRNLPQDD